MKQLISFNGTILFIVCCCLFSLLSCQTEESDNSIEMSEIVGSQWTSSYEWIEDNGSMESGNEVLDFISSTQARKTTEYSGRGWEFNYSTGENEYKSYSGTRYQFYEYSVSGSTILLINVDGGYSSELQISGNKLIDANEDQIWNLSKDGDGVGSGAVTSYTWDEMSGFWMADYPYEMYNEEMNRLERMNAPSSSYFNNPSYGYFRCWGIHFNKSGQQKEIILETRAFANQQTLRSIYASDRKTVYWTNTYTNSYSGIEYTIWGDTIYYAGEPMYAIKNRNTIVDNNGTLYVRGIAD